jgi:dihydropyrimidine dehydrogenase (NAD+) subunit PreA
MEDIDISVNFLDNKLINPFVLASAPPTTDLKAIRDGFEAGWAGAVTKSITLEPLVDKTPHIGHTKHKGKIIASQNYEMGSVLAAEQWVSWIGELSDDFPDRLLYVSLFAGPDEKEWEILSDMFKHSGADGLELNYSCPHSDHNGRGSIIGQNPDLCANLTKAVKDVVGDKLKIMPKMTYLAHPNEGLVSKMCIDAGADAIAGINTIAGLCEIDENTLEPKLQTGGKTTPGGYSYEIIRPFGRLIIANIAKEIDWKRYPISAMGGITTAAKSMIEYFALGANHLQVCTEVMNNGYQVIDKMITNLTANLTRNNRTLEDIRSATLSKVVPWNELDSIQRQAKINPSKCNSCYNCIPACMYNAIVKTEKIPKVTDNCNGCGSCYSICQRDAIEMYDT